jgi:HK97 family phage prohead protease
MGKRILRTTPLALAGMKVREAAEGEESRLVEGHAVVFGVRSVNLVPWSDWREVYEVMEPGCITPELINRSDVVLTAFHDNQLILGRSTNGKGTLALTIDERGMKQSCEWPNTTYADNLLESLKRGDISGMSFAFEADEDDSENGVSYERLPERSKDGKEIFIRHVKRVIGLYDVTVAGHPAYPQTDIARREIDAFLDQHCKRQENDSEGQRQREAEDQAKQEQQQREQEQQKAEALQREMERRASVLAKHNNYDENF